MIRSRSLESPIFLLPAKIPRPHAQDKRDRVKDGWPDARQVSIRRANDWAAAWALEGEAFHDGAVGAQGAVNFEPGPFSPGTRKKNANARLPAPAHQGKSPRYSVSFISSARRGLPLHCGCGLFPSMSMVTIEVQIDHGKLTPVEPQLLPEHGRGLLTVLTGTPGGRAPAVSIGSEADGLPVIRTQGGVITAELVREIEGFAG